MHSCLGSSKEIKGNTHAKRGTQQHKEIVTVSKKCRENKERRQKQDTIQMKSITGRVNKQAVDGRPDSTKTIWLDGKTVA